MAHKKGVGSSKNGRESESKRLGVKIFGGQAAIAGNINGFVEKKTDIEFKLGKLSIFIDDKNSVHMKGSVSDIKNIEIKI